MQASVEKCETNVKVVQVVFFYILTIFFALWRVKWEWEAFPGWVWPAALVVALLTLLIHPLTAAQTQAKSVWAKASLSALKWSVILVPMQILRNLISGEGLGLPMLVALLVVFLMLMLFSVLGNKIGERWPGAKEWF